jgi:hypothetical protein
MAVAGLLAAAGGLHLAALPSHLESSAAAGGFFAAIALAQLLGAVLIATRSSHRTTVVVIAGNLAVLAIWVVSRTTGLPVGGEIGAVEPVALLDGLAAAAEILVVAGGLRTVLRGRPALAVRSAGWPLGIALAAAWLVTGGVGTGLAGEHHHHDNATDLRPALFSPPPHSHAGCDVRHACGDYHRG